MPTDYAPRQKRPPPKGAVGKQIPALRAFGAGAACGIALTLALVYSPTLLSSDEAPADDAVEEAIAAAPSLTYEFMDRLPNEEVVTNVTPYEPPAEVEEAAEQAAEQVAETAEQDDAPPKLDESLAEMQDGDARPEDTAPIEPAAPLLASAQRSAPPDPVASETPSRQEYLLRTTSFDSRDEADALRARLILEGLAVAVKVVEGEGPEGASHRVVVGPFPNQLAMRETRTALRAEGIGLSPAGMVGG